MAAIVKKVSFRLLIGTSAIAAVFILGWAIGSQGINNFEKHSRIAVQYQLKVSQDLVSIRELHHEQTGEIRAITAGLSEQEQKAALNRMTGILSGIERLRAEYDKKPRAQADPKWADLKALWTKEQKMIADMIGFVREGKIGEVQAMHSRLETLSGQIDTALNVMSENNIAEIGARLNDRSQKTTRLTIMSIVVTGIGLIVLTAVGFFITMSVSNAIRKTVGRLTEGAEQFRRAATQISCSSNNLAEKTAAQAAAVEETTSVIENLSATSQRHLNELIELEKITQKADELRAASVEHLKEAVESMNGIKKTNDQTSTTLKAIDEISFQTNLLALNASIEASHAGDLGAGFAVVADEVRMLSLRSQDATKKTIDLINNTISAIYRSSEMIETNSAEFEKYTQQAQKFIKLLGELAQLFHSQLEAMKQIRESMTAANRSVQDTAMCADETASAAREMIAQSERIDHYVFKLHAFSISYDKSGRTEAAPRLIGGDVPLLAAPVHEVGI